MSDERFQKMFQVRRMPHYLFLTISCSWECFFQKDMSRNKVRYFWIGIGIIQWSFDIIIPIKIYGLRVVK